MGTSLSFPSEITMAYHKEAIMDMHLDHYKKAIPKEAMPLGLRKKAITAMYLVYKEATMGMHLEHYKVVTMTIHLRHHKEVTITMHPYHHKEVTVLMLPHHHKKATIPMHPCHYRVNTILKIHMVHYKGDIMATLISHCM